MRTFSFSLPKYKLTFNRQSIAYRLFISFFVVCLMMISLVLITVYQVNTTLRKEVYVSRVVQPTRIFCNFIAEKIESTNFLVQGQLLSQKILQGQQENRLMVWKQDIMPALDSLLMLSNEWQGNSEKLLLANVRGRINKLRTVQDAIELQIEKNVTLPDSLMANILSANLLVNNLDPKAMFKEQALEIAQEIKKDLARLNAIQTEITNQIIQSLNEEVWQFTLTEILILVVAISIAFLMSYSLTRSILANIRTLKGYITEFSSGNLPKVEKENYNEIISISENLAKLNTELKRIQDFALEVGSGNFESEISVFNNEGEIGRSLAEMRNGLVNVAIQDRFRNWANEGIALFGNLFRSSDDTAKLYDDFVRTLVQYMKAAQGSIFILRDDEAEPYLFLEAIYAFDRRYFLRKKIHRTQGMIGQVWQEKERMYLEKIPADFVVINSGLGSSKPSALLIEPILANDGEFLGVIELASFQTIPAYQLDFITRVAQVIASFISTLKKNEETGRLLQESQRTAELMLAQEEEMRQTMEGLVSRQEMLDTKLQQLEAQNKAINNTLAVVEFDMNGALLTANDIFLQSTGYTIEEVVGYPYLMFVPDEKSAKKQFEQLIDSLSKGHSQSGEFEHIGKNGKVIWFNSSFTVIKDYQNKPFKIIHLAYDVTIQKMLNLETQQFNVAISETNMVAEFDIRGHLIKSNDLFLRVMDYAAEAAKDVHHNVFLSPPDKIASQTKDFWEKLNAGQATTGRFKRITRQGREVWLRGSYNPILNNKKRVYKIIFLGQDITDAVNSERGSSRASIGTGAIQYRT
ncbi:MAG TPA: hypothetical protein DCM08_00320 [Microscillaceae bacterium]|nr:hypothetical protein [Microscillaceae bacterium]